MYLFSCCFPAYTSNEKEIKNENATDENKGTTAPPPSPKEGVFDKGGVVKDWPNIHFGD